MGVGSGGVGSGLLGFLRRPIHLCNIRYFFYCVDWVCVQYMCTCSQSVFLFFLFLLAEQGRGIDRSMMTGLLHLDGGAFLSSR